MSAVESLLLELGKLDVKLWADGERLRYSAPEGALSASLIALMKAHKAELLPLLGQDSDQRTNAIPRFPRDREILPSFGQERLWFLQQLEGASAAYNIPSAMRLKGRFDVDAARSAFQAILQRHEVLRTSFEDRDGHCVVVIAPELTLDIPLMDLSGLSESDQASEVNKLAREESCYVFDLAKAPLIRSLILRLGAEEHVLLTTLHHIVSDGWSTAIFVREFSQLYEQYAHGKSVSLPPLPIQYADYAMHQRARLSKETTASDLAYWKDLLAAAPPLLQLPTDRPRPNVSSFLGGSISIRIEPSIANRLRQITRQTNATMYMTLLAAFATLLARYSGQTKIVIGSPNANRKYPEVEPLIGFFLNTLVMPVDMTGDPTFSELTARVRQLALDSYAHQDLPFEHLVEALHPVRTLSHSPIFQAMFILQNNRTETLAIHGTQVQPIELEMSTEKFDLSLSLAENSDDSITGELGYSLDLFDAATANRMAGHLRNLLATVAQDSEQPISKLSLLSPPERQRIVAEWNNTDLPRPANICIHHLVEQQVERTPNAEALVFENKALTYHEYNERANRLAHLLASLGVGPEVRVGVCIDRSFEMMIALLAVWKAGAAYVPLDTSYPGERLAFMLEDAQVAVLLTLERHLEKLPKPSFPVICLDPSSSSASALAAQPVHNPQPTVTPDNLAYIIYTSGSTGRPKGVMNAHRGVCNRLLWGQETLGLQADDSVIQKTPIGFDVSVWEMFWPLMIGARLVIAVPDGHRDSTYLVDLIRRHAVTTIHFVAPMLGSFLEEEDVSACTTLRRVITSGEAVSPQLERRFFERLNVPLDDLYGPTEAAIEVSHWECGPNSELRAVPIGRPISNVQLYILDANLQPVPVGVTGELYIGGIAVARGYWKRPGLTASSFIPDPFSTLPGARLYRTGDGCRFLADGNIDFLGRLDQQIKIRGFRVELGEIETALQSIAEVREAVVLLRERQLVAYVIPSVSGVRSQDLQEALAKTLPDHMVPSHILFLDAFPIAPNGKLNRAALPAPPKADAVKSVAPRTETERKLATIWAEVLGIENIGINNDFFQIGGDSISSTRIVARARQAGLRITLKQIFQHHTIAALAANAEHFDTPALQLPEQIDSIPLTPIQRRFFQSFTRDPHYYNHAVLLETPGSLDEQCIEKALGQLAERHDSLRLRFHQDGTEWRQETSAGLPKPILTHIPVTGDEDWQSILDRHTAQLHANLNLSEGPIFQVAWFDRGVNVSGRLLFIAHHLAVDGVSWRILLDDLSRLLAGQILPPRQSVSFGQWAIWLNEQGHSIAANELEYWRGVARSQAASLPIDFPSISEENTFASVEGVTIELGISATEELLRRAANAGMQIHEILLAAVARTIANWSGGSTVLLEMEGHGRGEFSGAPDCTETVGWFTTTFPLALDLTNPDPLSIQDQWMTIPNHGAGYGVLRWLAKHDELEPLQEPQIAFNYLGRFDEAFNVANTELKFAGESSGQAISPCALRQHVLEVTAVIVGGSLRVTWAFSRNLHRRETIEHLANHCSEAIQAPLPDVARYSLSISQLGILIETLARPGSGIHIEQSAWTICGAFDPQRLISAFDQVVARHAALRTGFLWEGLAEPLQMVHGQVSTPVRIDDWSALSSSEQQENLAAFLTQDRERGFLLDMPPLLRLAIFRIAENAWKLVVIYHHLVLDGWSLALIFGDAMAFYRDEPNLSAVRPYRDYISWLRRQDLVQAERWWREELKGFTRPTRLISAMASGASAAHYRIEKDLPELLTRRIEETARRCGVTLNTMVQATWAILLGWWSGESDVLFGQTVSGRPSEVDGVDLIVGMFVNTVPIRCRIADTSSLVEFLQQIQTRMVEVDTMSFCSTAQIHQWSELPASSPLYQSILVFENYPTGPADAAPSLGFEVLEAQANGAQTNYPLTLLAAPGDSLRLCAVGTGSWTPDVLHQLLNVWQVLFTAAVEMPDSTISQLRNRLPDAPSHAPDTERSFEHASLAPRTVLEVQLVALWQDLLGVPNVGVRDNFFDLGGHSLLALRLVDRIAQQFQRPLSLSVVAQAGTIENLAQLLAENALEFNPLVQLRHSLSTELPLICIHPLGGSVICYASLARLLPMERSIYALQARGAEEGQNPAASIEEMAEDYIRAIRRVQPTGPYHLLGYSFGGYVALTVANLLQQEGHEIGSVVLLDTPHPSVVPVEIRRTDTAGLLVSLFAGSLDLPLEYLRSINEEQQLEFVYARAKEADLIPPGMSFDHARRYFEISRKNHSMDYTPVTYSLPITLIRASEQAERISNTPDLGWQSFSTLPVNVVWTPGMHETMLNPPFVETLAKLTNDVLTKGGR